MKIIKVIIISALVALGLSYFHNGRVARENMKFKLGLYDREAEENDIGAAIKQYNLNSAGFYNTAGDVLDGLALIPASRLLKRRHFKDINMLKGEGLVMIFDRDRVEVKRIYFPKRSIAIAETTEVWAVNLQKVENREPVSNVKAIDVKVRYAFHKEPYSNQGMKWIAQNVDVYPMDEEIPEIDVKPAL